MVYRLKVNQQWKIVVALILCPSFFVLAFIWIMLQFKNLPDWVVFAASFALVGLSAAVTLLIVLKWLTVECEIDMNEKHFHFKLTKESPFMHIHEFTSNWENIKNAATNFDSENGKVYYSIEFRQPALTLYLSPVSGENDAEDFREELDRYVQKYNNTSQNPSMKINATGFYEKGWAKIFTYFLIAITLFIIIATILDPAVNVWWRAVAVCVYTLPWLAGYYRAKKAKSES